MAEEDGSSNAGLAIGVVALVVALVLSAVVTGLCCLWCRAKKKLVYLGEFLCLEPVVCFNPLTMSSVYYVSQSSSQRAYIYAHTGIHSLPDADMANKLPRKPLLIPTDVSNASNDLKLHIPIERI